MYYSNRHRERVQALHFNRTIKLLVVAQVAIIVGVVLATMYLQHQDLLNSAL